MAKGSGDSIRAMYLHMEGMSVRIRLTALGADRPSAPDDFMKKYTADNEARRRARQVIGMPSKTRVIPDKRRKREKHKKSVQQLQTAED